MSFLKVLVLFLVGFKWNIFGFKRLVFSVFRNRTVEIVRLVVRVSWLLYLDFGLGLNVINGLKFKIMEFRVVKYILN